MRRLKKTYAPTIEIIIKESHQYPLREAVLTTEGTVYFSAGIVGYTRKYVKAEASFKIARISGFNRGVLFLLMEVVLILCCI